MLGAGLIWIVIAVNWHGDTHAVEQAVKHYLLEYAELLLFLLAAMTYVNALSECFWAIGSGGLSVTNSGDLKGKGCNLLSQ